MTINGHDTERQVNLLDFLWSEKSLCFSLQCVKKQRTEEQISTNKNLLDCIDEILTTTTMVNKRALKRKHRREQRANLHSNKKETKQIKTTYDR